MASTIFGPDANGTVGFGPTGGGTIAFGFLGSTINGNIDPSVPPKYQDLRDEIGRLLNEGDDDGICDLFTGENLATVKQCAFDMIADNVARDTTKRQPIFDEIKGFEQSIAGAQSIDDIIGLYSATNVSIAQLSKYIVDTPDEYEGLTAGDIEVGDYIDTTDQVTANKIDLLC